MKDARRPIVMPRGIEMLGSLESTVMKKSEGPGRLSVVEADTPGVSATCSIHANILFGKARGSTATPSVQRVSPPARGLDIASTAVRPGNCRAQEAVPCRLGQPYSTKTCLQNPSDHIKKNARSPARCATQPSNIHSSCNACNSISGAPRKT